MEISEAFLNKVATFYTKTQGVANAFGEKSFTLTEVADEVKVALQVADEELEFGLQGNTYVVKDILYLNYRSDISPGDLVTIDSLQYLIVSIEDESGQGTHLKMYITKA